MDDSAMDMTAACNTLDNTKRELLSTQDKYEVILQENHELKKKIEVVDRINTDLESELTYLNSVKAKESLKVLNLQSELDSANARVKQLESLLEEERLNLQRFIRDSNENKNKEIESKTVVIPDQEELNFLTGEITKLQEQQEEDKQSISTLLNEKVTNGETLKQLKQDKQLLQEELTEIKEHLQQKTIDLRNVNESLESLREEKLILSTELQILRSSDSNASSRGNSLFAEVEDNRQKVVAQREVLKLKYLNLKKVLNQSKIENNKLKLEIVKIRREEKDDEKSIHRDYSDLMQTYKERVSELEHQMITLKQRSDQPPVPTSAGDNSHLEWVNTVVENARKEARTLHAELERRGSNYVVQGHQLFDSQKQNRKLKAINLKLQSEIDELRLKLDLLKASENDVDEGISPPAIEIAVAYQKQKMVKFKEVLHQRNNTSLSNEKDSDKEN